ncbi:MAG: ribosome small subunit-dependent GTPase A [Anaerolineales bacterium]
MQNENTDIQINGVVYKKLLGHYEVHHDHTHTTCILSAKLWKDFEYAHQDEKSGRVTAVGENHMDPVAVGDRVAFKPTDDGSGMILEVHPRQNYLARGSAKPNPRAYSFEQVIAANLDQIMPVFAAANPQPKWHMLDRILVAAESHHIPSQIVITKFDLVKGDPKEEDILTVIDRYRKIGYPVIVTSAVVGRGLDSLKTALSQRTSLLVGKSGVGKSTLLNSLEPGLGIKVQSVNPSTGKGRHTTSHLEMFPLAMGGAIIDTPGTREFGLWGLDERDLADCFPEMRPLIGKCKFGLSCKHNEEPNCAIRHAVMDGIISPYRYRSYLQMRLDL